MLSEGIHVFLGVSWIFDASIGTDLQYVVIHSTQSFFRFTGPQSRLYTICILVRMS